MRIVQFMASSKYVGAERSFVELCNELSKSDEVYAIVVRDCEFEERFDSAVKVLRLRSSSARSNPFLYLEILSILKRLGPDLVHAHSSKAAKILYRLYRIADFPLVATKRNMRRDPVFDKIPYPVAVSEAVGSVIENPAKTVIYNGLRIRKAADVPKENVFTVVAVGALRKIKGFAELIEVFAELDPDARLWIAGEGEERKTLESLVENLGMRDKVILKGHREDIPELLERAHMQVVNSVSEGFGRVIVEGLFHSDLLISARVGIADEVLDERLLFDRGGLGSKIADAIKRYDEYRGIFKESRLRYARNFTLEGMTERYRELYRDIIEEAGDWSPERSLP